MLKKIGLLLLVTFSQYAAVEDIFSETEQKVVIATQKITFDRFPEAFNPSLVKIDGGFLLTFRDCPDRENQFWLSDIWFVQLDTSFNPVAEPVRLNTRSKKSKTPSQAEDARLFAYRDKLFLLYNDNIDEIFFDQGKRRDIFLAELFFADDHFQLSSPLKLLCEEKYNAFLQQKNWIPFEWQNGLYFVYSINPHEILSPNLRNGVCYSLYKTAPSIHWIYGSLRGSSSAQLVDGEYLVFFHSGAKIRSPASYDWKLWHYFMGAYTFSAEPPFKITKMTPQPIMHEDFYTPSYREKRVVFPGGFVVDGPHIYVAYGKDDCEIWIATLDKEELKKTLVPVQ